MGVGWFARARMTEAILLRPGRSDGPLLGFPGTPWKKTSQTSNVISQSFDLRTYWNRRCKSRFILPITRGDKTTARGHDARYAHFSAHASVGGPSVGGPSVPLHFIVYYNQLNACGGLMLSVSVVAHEHENSDTNYIQIYSRSIAGLEYRNNTCTSFTSPCVGPAASQVFCYDECA
jgi:hypothetical protein